MGEPKAITFKQVEKAAKERGENAYELWEKIGKITGAGTPGLDADHNASIDLTNESDSVLSRIEAATAPKTDDAQTDEAARSSTKRGK